MLVRVISYVTAQLQNTKSTICRFLETGKQTLEDSFSKIPIDSYKELT